MLYIFFFNFHNLVKLFNKFLYSFFVPIQWKKAEVSPIYKNKRERDSIMSNRPISVTSTFSRIFEHVVARRLERYLESINFVSKNQHGFWKNKNTQSNLLETYNFVTASLDKGDAVDIVYIDLEKAFDKIDTGKIA